jgi:trehalose/maltose hydrolase-like predicted phosphorylase
VLTLKKTIVVLFKEVISLVFTIDKTKVGWWKNGYPEYFAKVLNAPNWIG